jgi:hypothetical protein
MVFSTPSMAVRMSKQARVRLAEGVMRRSNLQGGQPIAIKVELWLLSRFEVFALARRRKSGLRRSALKWIDARHLRLRSRISDSGPRDGTE